MIIDNLSGRLKIFIWRRSCTLSIDWWLRLPLDVLLIDSDQKKFIRLWPWLMAWGIFSTFSIFIKTAQIKLLPWSGGKLNCISFQVTLVTSWKVIVTLKTSNGQWNHHSDDFKCPFADTSSGVIVQWYSNSKHIYIWIDPLHICPF